jgi:predicted site-specific integrase-resolvase
MTHDFYFSQTALAERYRVDKRTIQRWRDAGKLPSPDKLPSGRYAWGNKAIEAYERSLVSDTAA